MQVCFLQTHPAITSCNVRDTGMCILYVCRYVLKRKGVLPALRAELLALGFLVTLLHALQMLVPWQSCCIHRLLKILMHRLYKPLARLHTYANLDSVRCCVELAGCPTCLRARTVG
jgi:hypothetical protein